MNIAFVEYLVDQYLVFQLVVVKGVNEGTANLYWMDGMVAVNERK